MIDIQNFLIGVGFGSFLGLIIIFSLWFTNVCFGDNYWTQRDWEVVAKTTLLITIPFGILVLVIGVL